MRRHYKVSSWLCSVRITIECRIQPTLLYTQLTPFLVSVYRVLRTRLLHQSSEDQFVTPLVQCIALLLCYRVHNLIWYDKPSIQQFVVPWTLYTGCFVLLYLWFISDGGKDALYTVHSNLRFRSFGAQYCVEIKFCNLNAVLLLPGENKRRKLKRKNI